MMLRGDSFEKALYRAANAAVLSGIGLFLPFLGIDAVTWKNLFVAAVVLAYFTLISVLPARGKGLCLLLTVVCLGVPAVMAGTEESYAFFQSYLQWVMGAYNGPERWQSGFLYAQTAVVAGGAFFLQLLLEKTKYLKHILAFICADGLLFCLFSEISLPHMSVVLMLFYIVLVCAEWQQEHWEKRLNGSRKAQMLWLAPFFGIYLLLMAVMPAPDRPYDWKWARQLYSQVRESFLELSQNILRGGSEDFDASLSGFSDDGDLGGRIDEDGRQVMELHAQNRLMTNMYLIGKVFDSFDGRQWTQENLNEENDRVLDTLETLYVCRMLGGNNLFDYLRRTTVKIRYEYFNTGYVFAPLKTRRIEGIGSDLGYSSKSGDLVMGEHKGYGTEYEVEYYQLNMGEDLFNQLLTAPKESSEALWKVMEEEYERETGQEMTMEMLEEHRRAVYENYLEAPTLSQEARDYLSEITKGAENDLEKLQAIERMLQSYTYTTNPGVLPDKVTGVGEFLDYFLLESRQGYCTYFATAFVLLARAEGIPARYVQGFCVPMAGKTEAVVLSSMAHSWPEVYMDGVGWIPFEPTPGYGSLRYTPWKVSNRGTVSFYEEDEDEEEEEEQENVIHFTDLDKELDTEEEYSGQELGWQSGAARFFGVLAICVAVIFAGLGLALAFDNLVGAYRYGKMNAEERLKAEVRRNLRMLSWLGIKRDGQETMQELRGRVMDALGPASLHFIEDYEDVIYGGKRAEDAMLQGVKKDREGLWELIKAKKKWRYYLYRAKMFLVRYR